MMAYALFYALLAVIAYAYVGYPLLVLVRGLVWRRPFRRESITPRVSLIIACHNEQAGIGTKLENILAMDYPAECLQVLIASDGSTDQTEALVHSAAEANGDSRVQLLRLPRQGKAAALNAAVEVAQGEVLVFSDANSLYAVDALRHLVAPFADPGVGGVAGNQVYRQSYRSGAAAAGEQTYWSFDRLLKAAQSRSGDVISATGAIYAVRRDLFRPVPAGVTDDFVTSTRVIEQGRRLVFVPEAVCFEPVAGTARAEFGRKTRVMTRGFRGVFVMRRLLNPFRYGFYSLQLFSHKVLRRLVAVPLIALAAVTPFLWNEGRLFQAAAVLQGAFYLCGLLGGLLSRAGIRIPRLLALPFYFCMVNAAALVALWNVLRGRRIELWNPHRGETTPSSTLPARLQEVV